MGHGNLLSGILANGVHIIVILVSISGRLIDGCSYCVSLCFPFSLQTDPGEMSCHATSRAFFPCSLSMWVVFVMSRIVSANIAAVAVVW